MNLGTSARTANPESPIKATFAMEPHLSFDATVCEWPNEFAAATVVAPLRKIAQYLNAPVRSFSPGRLLTQSIIESWDRILQPWGSLEIPLPVIVSARTNWMLKGSRLEIFAESYILDGACRVESLLEANADVHMTFIALFGLKETDELNLRQNLFGDAVPEAGETQRCGTDTPRVKLSTTWVPLVFASDPFVVPTSRGYAPAILVKRRGMTQHEHILIGARSLADPIETLRVDSGSLEGIEVRIRKSGDTPVAPYEVEVI
jgi:hypothetical protein